MTAPAPNVNDLVRDYQPLALSLARRFAPGQFLWLRDDFTSAALEALWKAAQSYDPARGLAFATWVRGDVRYALLRRLQIERKKNAAAFRAVPPAITGDGRAVDAVERLPDDAPQPDETLARNEYVAQLLAAIPKGDREMVIAHVMRGESLVAIGAERGVTATRAGQIVKRALARLRELRTAA